jgi:hypothetical protein
MGKSKRAYVFTADIPLEDGDILCFREANEDMWVAAAEGISYRFEFVTTRIWSMEGGVPFFVTIKVGEDVGYEVHTKVGVDQDLEGVIARIKEHMKRYVYC